MEEISLRELFFIIRRRIALIILLFIIGVSVAGLVSYYVLDPEYQTFTTLMVGKPKDYQLDNKIEYNDLMINQRLVSTYGELIKSRSVTDKVIENLGLNLSYNSFRNKVAVNLVKDTEIIKIQVTDNNPKLAADIANEIALVFIEKVVEIMKVENVQVIDRAQIPTSHIKPRPMLNMAIAGVLGIMSGVFLVFLLEFLDNTIKTPEDVERSLGLPVLAAIPISKDEDKQLMTSEDPKSPISEAFRVLRTNIQFSSIDDEMKVLVITSSTPTEGKSTVAANLASTVAQNEKRVLLIDCDLRKPNVHKIFGFPNLLGLTNVLVGDKKYESVICNFEKTPNLDIISSGPIPPNPAELLGSRKMKEFLENVKDDYDLIILDTPPVGLVTDGAVISTLADGLIQILAVGQTDIEMAKRAKELLDKVNANIIGTVLNRVPTESKYYYKYSYYHYDQYYNEDKGSKNRRKRK